jgi:SAM dependent carboxyl methyltransferase
MVRPRGTTRSVRSPTAIGILRERLEPERAISVVHTDLPDNDFTALFRTLAADPNSYLRGNSEVFALAVGRSFYEQILPASSVTLAWSSWARIESGRNSRVTETSRGSALDGPPFLALQSSRRWPLALPAGVMIHERPCSSIASRPVWRHG